MEIDNSNSAFTVFTIDQAMEFIAQLENLLKEQYLNNEDQWRKKIEEVLSDVEYQYIQKRQGNIGDVLQAVHDELLELPVIDVTLAFSPTYKFISTLVEWFTVYGPGSGKIQISVNPDIVGGVVIGYDGRLYDYSLAKSIEAHDGIRTIA